MRFRDVLGPRVVLLFAVAAVPIVVFGNWWAWWVANLIAMAVIFVDFYRAPRQSELVVTVPATLTTRVDHAAATQLELLNTGARSGHITMRWVWQPSVAVGPGRFTVRSIAGQRRYLAAELLPRRGGTMTSDMVAVRVLGPWRLAGTQAEHHAPTELRSRPRHPSARLLPSKLVVLEQTDGRMAVRQRGEGTEFDSLREYVLGDDRRSIDWRATARSRNTMVRTWQPERDQRLLVVLDSGRHSAAHIGDLTRLDGYVDATLLLSAVAAHGGDQVSVLAFTRGVRRQVSASGTTGVVGRIGAALTGLTPELLETDYSAMSAEVLRRTTQRQTIVVLTAADKITDLPRWLRPLGIEHDVIVGQLDAPWPEPPDELSATYRQAVAQLRSQESDRTRQQLTAAGVSVVQAPADRFAEALTDRYLSLRFGH